MIAAEVTFWLSYDCRNQFFEWSLDDDKIQNVKRYKFFMKLLRIDSYAFITLNHLIVDFKSKQ